MKLSRIAIAALLALCLSFGALAECRTEFHDDCVTVTLSSGMQYDSYDFRAASVRHVLSLGVLFDDNGFPIRDSVRQYDADGRLIREGMGMTGYWYEYDADGRLSKLTEVSAIYEEGMDGEELVGYDIRTAAAEYGDDGSLALIAWSDGVREEYAGGKLLRREYANGGAHLYEYDDQGRVYRVVSESSGEVRQTCSYDEQGRLAEWRQYNGYGYTVEYAADGSMTVTVADFYSDTVYVTYLCNAEGWILKTVSGESFFIEYEYDGTGRKTRETQSSLAEAGYYETVCYNENGLPLSYESMYDGAPYRKEYFYLEGGYLVEYYVCNDGTREDYEYYENGALRLVRYSDGSPLESFAEYYPSGALMKEGYSESGHSSYSEYDGEGWLIRYVEPDSSYEYEYLTPPDSRIDSESAIERVYDADGNLTEERIVYVDSTFRRRSEE